MPTDDTVIVTPLASAEAVAQPEIPNPPAPAEAPEQETPAAESVEGVSQDKPDQEEKPKADPPKPEKSHREKLIDQLTDAEPAPEDDDEEAETPAATEQDKANPAPATDAPKPKQPDEIVPDDLVELTNDTAKAMKPGEARRKINRLIKRVKENEPLAQGYREIITACEKNNFAPDDYRAWVGIGIGLQQGNPQAIEALKSVAAKAGVLAAPAPVGLTKEMDEFITSQVKNLEMSEAAAALLRKQLSASPTPAPTPAPAPAPAQQPPQQQPHADPMVTSRRRAEQAMDKITADFEQKIGAERYAEIEPRILTALKEHSGAHPDAWPSILRSVIAAEVAKLPKPAAVNPSLRPGRTGGSAAPTFKTERARTIHRLTSG